MVIKEQLWQSEQLNSKFRVQLLLSDGGFLISGSQAVCCILDHNSSMVASWISTVLHIVILCGSEIYIGSSANRLLYIIHPVILKHLTPCITTFLLKISRVVCLPEETLTNFSHPTSISLKFYLPIDSNDVSIRIYQQAYVCACSVKSDSLQPHGL